MIRADMHVHTYCSDGTMSPEEAVKEAKANGVGLLVITDHDNMNATGRALKSCKELGVFSVSGIEISAYEGDVKVHTLGYGLDMNCAVFKNFYAEQVQNAERRTLVILKKLKGAGIDITLEEAERERVCPESPLHASYIARAGAKKGYCASAGEFYFKYLNYGTVGFTAEFRPTPQQAVEVIARSGGVSSLAHPGRLSLDEEAKTALVKKLKDSGLCGIEAVYSAHTMGETAYYKEMARRFGLLVTGGSDTHGLTADRRKIGTPEFYPDDELLAALKII